MPTAPESLPTATRSRATRNRSGRGQARTPSRRASGRTSSARRGPRGCGRPSACPGAPGPSCRIVSVRRPTPSTSRSPASRRDTAVAVSSTSDEVSPIVDVPAGLADVLSDVLDERDDVVVTDLFDLGDPGDVERGLLFDLGEVLDRHLAAAGRAPRPRGSRSRATGRIWPARRRWPPSPRGNNAGITEPFYRAGSGAPIRA